MKPVRPLWLCTGAGTPRRPNLGNLREVPIAPLADYHSPLLCWNSGRLVVGDGDVGIDERYPCAAHQARLAEAIRPCAVVTATVRVSLQHLPSGGNGERGSAAPRVADRRLRAGTSAATANSSAMLRLGRMSFMGSLCSTGRLYPLLALDCVGGGRRAGRSGH